MIHQHLKIQQNYLIIISSQTVFTHLEEMKKRESRDLTGVVVRLFIGTQNRLVALHSALIKVHEETDLSPRSVIYRPVGPTMQLVTKLSSPNFAVLQGHRYLEPSILGVQRVACRASTS
jgi:hypothetical protein